MSRRNFVASCLGLGAAWLGVVLFGSTSSGSDGGRSSFVDHSVILVSLDGFAHFYLDDPRADIPTLRRMIREGAVADRGMEC